LLPPLAPPDPWFVVELGTQEATLAPMKTAAVQTGAIRIRRKTTMSRVLRKKWGESCS
jgi:hypothetical protein